MISVCLLFVFFFKQKTAYEMRISDWSSDVCSSDLQGWTLDALTVAAWQLRPELAQARAGERAASADVAAAARKPNPLLSFTPEWIYNAPAGVSTWIAALLVSQVFENPDKRAARSAQARGRAQQASGKQAKTAR